MGQTYYDSTLTDEQIQAALDAIYGLIVPANNGKAIAVSGGKLVARSVTWGGGSPTLQSKTVTPGARQQIVLPDLGYDGLSDVTVNGDADLVAANIRKDVEIFGVTGNFEGSGGGSTNILAGATYPTTNVGNDGDIYLQYRDNISNITNIRMVIYNCRNTGSDTQVAEIQLLDSDGYPIIWGSGTATSNGNVYSTTQTADKAFNNVTNDKWYTNSHPSIENPIWIDFAPDTPIPSFSSWQWLTGDDSPNRDPTTFALEISTDDGSNYIEVDRVSGALIPTSRNVIGYTGIVEWGVVIAAYCKVNGAWQNLIGTDIDDVNLGS